MIGWVVYSYFDFKMKLQSEVSYFQGAICLSEQETEFALYLPPGRYEMSYCNSLQSEDVIENELAPWTGIYAGDKLIAEATTSKVVLDFERQSRIKVIVRFREAPENQIFLVFQVLKTHPKYGNTDLPHSFLNLFLPEYVTEK